MSNGSLKLILFLFIFLFSFSSFSDPISGQSVNLKVLDKISSKIQSITIKVNEFLKFGTLKIEVYACFKRPPEEVPEDFVLLRIFDTNNDNDLEKVYQGWMISSNPTATPFEHPIYDIWVNDCNISIDSS
ncbi:MAG: hypothetical protein CFH16_00712 [Alphaproteobacteria bacterium MarineAlpha5_Bin6]|nr:MAG: hypothetical protein CFH17_00554 [Alphaproteobacteria bacterium MarineAlpha5_Bin7]PPR53953.1 MAG: hypothetical protein CFH16_00712 [Alphaproteobacteria bacterium MarineAlpha5_Bin6]|tara:strand:+ start:5664 stop:6053 length:390 start_codon:yes stop_codon:yes gene_type:complete